MTQGTVRTLAEIREDNVPVPQSTCCEACAETLAKVTEIHAGFSALAGALPLIMQNPMLKAMSRQFGIDPDAISAQLKG